MSYDIISTALRITMLYCYFIVFIQQKMRNLGRSRDIDKNRELYPTVYFHGGDWDIRIRPSFVWSLPSATPVSRLENIMDNVLNSVLLLNEHSLYMFIFWYDSDLFRFEVWKTKIFL